MGSYYFEDSKIEVLQDSYGDCVVKDKAKERYYFKKKLFFFESNGISKTNKIRWNIVDSIMCILIAVSILCMVTVFIGGVFKPKYSNFNGFADLFGIYLFTIINLILHECAHFTVMRLYGRKAGHIKLKLYAKIFPCLIVNTSDAYMLPRYRRAFVYYAGIMINWIVCGIMTVISSKYKYYTAPLAWIAVYNMIPFGGIKTDGYRIIINCILNKKDYICKESIASRLLKYAFWLFALYSTYESWKDIIFRFI